MGCCFSGFGGLVKKHTHTLAFILLVKGKDKCRIYKHTIMTNSQVESTVERNDV